MHLRIIIGLLVFCMFFLSCKPKSLLRPAEYYEDIEEDNPVSTMNLPIRISKAELENTINHQLGEILFEDDEMKGDGLKLKATKKDNVQIKVQGQRVTYRVPVELWVQKDLALTIVEGEGAMTIELATDFDIQPDWNFETKTELVRYQWTKTPIVRTPLGNLNVTGIADEFIDQFKAEITSNIDLQLRESLDLKKEIGKAWKEMQKPFLLSDETDSYLSLNPTKIEMTQLRTENEMIQSTVVISASPQLYYGETPTLTTITQLPDFQYIEQPELDNFSIFLSTSIGFNEAEKIAKFNMEGETYNYGKRSVRVEDVELFGQGNKLVIKTNLSGDYNGDVFLLGKPAYNSRRNKIELEDVEFDFSSKKTLMRTATWLFKGSFKRKVQDELNFQLSENLEATKASIHRELEHFELAPGINLNGMLSDLSISKVYIGADAIHVKVGLDGKLNLEVNSFGN